MINKKIFISGLGVYSPVGYGIKQTWDNISNGYTGLEKIKDWENSNIRSHYYGLPQSLSFKEEIKWPEMFPPTRYSLLGMYACKKAIEDAKLNLNTENNEIGMVIDTSMGSASSVEQYLQDLYQRGLSKISPMKFTKTVTNTAIGDISRLFKLNGPSSLLLNECSLCYGIDLVRKGVIDMVICGAIDHYTDYYVLSEQESYCLIDERYSLEEAISKTERIEQKMLGEGACFIVIETQESIKKRGVKPYAEIVDYNTSFDYENIDSTTRRTQKNLRNNIMGILDYIPNDSDILWFSPFQTDIQKSTNEPKELLADLIAKNIHYSSHKEYTGDMRSASSLFGILLAAKSLHEKKYPADMKGCHKSNANIALVNTTQEGGSSSLFLLKNLNS
ncbi:beta-ketoacyl synthase N-terminal-like domain-containing protein [Bacteroides graminisolvens]|uniref:beta-ketoacyl synthase N-terminal-like domain-containing protein n=1 Tax=Bacteroides graminisolvens TaxID=477666 RepID=UPI0004220E73|nr:beta-ketoacyl synthase N-terminal-like domain-containing protein [Bacteroides graminisolvens]